MLVFNELIAALANVILLFAIPLSAYAFIQRWRGNRDFSDIARRLGMTVGDWRYLMLCSAVALVIVGVLVAFPPTFGTDLDERNAMRPFAGLGINATTVLMALIYGVVKTGFAEEFLFRGLIAGVLARRMSLIWANAVQAVIFLVPHLLILTVMPEMAWLLPVIFVGALFAGWVRINSGSFYGPWILHAAINTAMCLLLAAHGVATALLE